MNNLFLNRINDLLEYTTQISFPLFASEKRKKELLNEEKEKIEYEIEQLLLEFSFSKIPNEEKNLCWEKAAVAAAVEFSSLPNNLKLNSFYLQEVCHNYVENLLEVLRQERK